MKKFIGILLALYLLTFLFGADQEDFPDIYIDESVAPGGVGSEADPYSDFSEINWTTGGDNSIFDWYAGVEDASATINLQEGEEWREQLTIGESGSATYPIIIQSYGSAAKPIINGSDILTGFEPSGAWADIFSATPDTNLGEGVRNYINIINADLSAVSGTKIRITFQAADASGCTISGTSLGVSTANDDFTHDPATWTVDQGVRITWDTGNNTTTIAAGNSKVSDDMDLNFDKTLRYRSHLYTTDRSVKYDAAPTPGAVYFDAGVADDTLTQNVGYAGAAGCMFKKLEVFAGTASYEKAGVTTEPNIVFYDGTKLTENDGATTGVGADEWDWAADVLYVNVGEDPDTGVLEAGQRDYAVDVSAKNYITIKDIVMTKANDFGIKVDNSNYCVIQDSTISYSASVGIRGLNTPDNLTISDSAIEYNGGTGISIDAVTDVTIEGNTIQANENSQAIWGVYTNGNIYGNTIYNNGLGGDYGFDHGIYVDVGTTGINIYQNIIYGHTKGHGIQIKGSASIYKNEVYGNYAAGIYMGENDTNDVVVSVYYNLSYDNKYGFLIANKEAGDLTATVYNNVFYQNDDTNEVGTPAEVAFESDATAVTLKNNIIFTTDTTYTYSMITQTGMTCDYNCVYRAGAGDFIYYNAAARTWAYWQGTVIFDVNGINSNPHMIDPANDDFRLLMASPCINKGTDVSLTTDYRDRSIRHAPDIGAYEDPTNVLFMTKLFEYLKEKK